MTIRRCCEDQIATLSGVLLEGFYRESLLGIVKLYEESLFRIVNRHPRPGFFRISIYVECPRRPPGYDRPRGMSIYTHFEKHSNSPANFLACCVVELELK